MRGTKRILDDIADEHEAVMLVAEGLDTCVIGITYTPEPLFVYSIDKVIKVLIDRDGMTEEEAVEFFHFNIGGYRAEGAPIFITEIEPRIVMEQDSSGKAH